VLALHQKRVGPSTATILSKRYLATECMLQMAVAGPPPRIYLIKEHYDPAEEMSIKKPNHSLTSSGQPTLLPHHQMRQAACLWNWHLLMGSPGHYCWLESLPASYHPTFRVQCTELGDGAPWEGTPLPVTWPYNTTRSETNLYQAWPEVLPINVSLYLNGCCVEFSNNAHF
jgi:hypothetical protein